ncbi:MAG: hypothetical protein LBJ13_00885 [Puniceicoccales bacterium]|nr:hypothetical protein [Puniceicoccales bacterium]
MWAKHELIKGVFSEESFEMPVYDRSGMIAPVFITSQATAEGGDGIFRIELTRNGWTMRNTPKGEGEMDFETFSRGPRIAMKQAMVNEIFSSVQMQKEVISKLQREILDILPSQLLIVQAALDCIKRMSTDLIPRFKRAAEIGRKYEIASGFLGSIRVRIDFFRGIIPDDKREQFETTLTSH